MKKILSVLLAISLFASLAVAFAVPATAEENLCGYFDDRVFWRGYISEVLEAQRNNGTIVKCDDLSNRDFGWITSSQYKGDKVEFGWYDSETGTFTVTDGGYCQRIPAAEFEELVKKTFLCGDDFAQRLKDGANDLIVYDSKTDSYIVCDRGTGGGAYRFSVRGYNNAGKGTYSVYLQEFGDGDYEYDSKDEFLSAVESGEIAVGKTYENSVITEIDLEKRIFWYDSYIKFTVEYDGEYTKALSVEKVSALPSADKMITPEYTDRIRYYLSDSIEVDGGDAFPNGTVITANGIEVDSGGKVAGSLKGIAKDGKIQAFEINATLSGAAVQPNGKVKVTIYLADYLTAENLKMYYIAEDGTREEIKITVTGRTVTAELEHFSTYALCNVAENAGGGAVSTSKSPKTGDSAAYIYLGIMAVSAAAVISASVISKRGRKENV